MVFLALHLQIRQAQDLWADGRYAKDRDLELATLGKLSAFKGITGMDYEELQGLLNDE